MIENPSLFHSDKVPLSYRVALYLGIVEIGIGSLLHTFRFPFVGYCLSLHQTFCLARVQCARVQCNSDKQSKNLPVIISVIAAFFKAMGPAHKRLTPFLAIIMQGVLFNIGTIIFGRNIIGQSVGAIFSSFWGFLQPLLIAYFIFGAHMLEGFHIVQQFCTNYVPFANPMIVIFICVILKVILSVIVIILARTLNANRFIPIENSLFSFSKKVLKKSNKCNNSLVKELVSVWFLLPLGLSMISVMVTEPDLVNKITIFLRMVGCYIIFSMVLRSINMEKLIQKMHKSGYINLSKHLDYCVDFFKTSERP